MEEIFCKYYKEKKQISSNYGQDWEDTGDYREGELYQYDSDDCAYTPTPIQPDEYYNKYLTFVFEDTGSIHRDGIFGNDGYYSIDSGVTWVRANTEYIPYDREQGNRIYLHSGDTIMLKAEITPTSGYTYKVGTFVPTCNAHVEGNVMSLIYGDNFIGKTTIPNGLNFSHLFDSADFGPSTAESMYLTNAEHIVLPATTLTKDCYNQMFFNTRIVKGPKVLPATTLTNYCYFEMFMNCTSLTTAPELPAPKLVADCYSFMFSNCSSLNYIKCLAQYSIGGEAGSTTQGFTYGVAESGKFIKNPIMPYDWPIGSSGIPSGWAIINADELYEEQYLTFIAQDNGIFSFNGTSGGDIVNDTIYYSLDNGSTWSTLASGSTSPTINSGNKIMWKGELQSYGGIGTFSSTGRYSVEGNAMSLLYGNNFIGQTTIESTGALEYLFQGSTGLTSVENMVLPATSLLRACYYGMFSGCTALTTAMEILPCTGTIPQSAYGHMFEGCTSLTRAPELPGKLGSSSSSKNSYNRMFYGCSSLNYIKCLTTIVPSDDYGYPSCTGNWVYGVAATGTFVKNASKTWPTGDKWTNSSIPDGWTVIDAT